MGADFSSVQCVPQAGGPKRPDDEGNGDAVVDLESQHSKLQLGPSAAGHVPRLDLRSSMHKAPVEEAGEPPTPHSLRIVVEGGSFRLEDELLARQDDLKKAEQDFGPQSLEAARALETLANTHSRLRRHEEQVELLDRSVAIREAQSTGPDIFLAEALEELAIALGRVGSSPVRRKQLLERALDVQKLVCSADRMRIARTQVRLGNVHGAIGNCWEKVRLLKEALLVLEEDHGTGNHEVACTLTNLGNAYMVLGMVAEQTAALERSLEMKEQLHGESHASLVTTLTSLSDAFGRQGKLNQQEHLLERALRISEQENGRDHWSSATILDNMGSLYLRMGDVCKALDLLQRALVLKERNDGPDHPQVAVTLANLGVAYKKAGQSHKCEEVLVRALGIAENCGGPTHPQTRRLRKMIVELGRGPSGQTKDKKNSTGLDDHLETSSSTASFFSGTASTSSISKLSI